MPLRPLVRGLGGQVLRGPAAPRRAGRPLGAKDMGGGGPIRTRGSCGWLRG